MPDERNLIQQGALKVTLQIVISCHSLSRETFYLSRISTEGSPIDEVVRSYMFKNFLCDTAFDFSFAFICYLLFLSQCTCQVILMLEIQVQIVHLIVMT